LFPGDDEGKICVAGRLSSYHVFALILTSIWWFG